jgi:hypothetical protein
MYQNHHRRATDPSSSNKRIRISFPFETATFMERSIALKALESARATLEAAQREEAARLREEAKAEALALIKPQLQRQQAVEVAIREAEERARDRERQLASQVRA